MPTISAQEIENTVVNKLSGKDAIKWAKLLKECLSDFEIGEYPLSYRNVIFQKWERFKPTIYDAYGFLNIHTFIHTGEIAMFSIPVASEPHSDRNIDGNNEVLNMIPEPYSARFFGGTQDEDGFFKWDRPVHGAVSIKQKGIIVGCVIPPLTVPLEVGTCSADKMYLYLCPFANSFGVARWPYGANKITVMVRNFCGTKSEIFNDLVRDVGEDISAFMLDDNRNPHLEWNRHESKRKKHIMRQSLQHASQQLGLFESQ